MASQSTLVGSVLSLQDHCFFYPSCRECLSRLIVNKNRCYCRKCGYSCEVHNVCYRYRLSLGAADKNEIFGVTVFGSCLDPYFGVTAGFLQRFVEDLKNNAEEVDYDRQRSLLIQAVEYCFIGRHFIFGVKLSPSQTKADPLNSETTSQTLFNRHGYNRQLIAYYFSVPNTSLFGCTVMSYFKELLQSFNVGHFISDSQLPGTCSHTSEIDNCNSFNSLGSYLTICGESQEACSLLSQSEGPLQQAHEIITSSLDCHCKMNLDGSIINCSLWDKKSPQVNSLKSLQKYKCNHTRCCLDSWYSSDLQVVDEDCQRKKKNVFRMCEGTSACFAEEKMPFLRDRFGQENSLLSNKESLAFRQSPCFKSSTLERHHEATEKNKECDLNDAQNIIKIKRKKNDNTSWKWPNLSFSENIEFMNEFKRNDKISHESTEAKNIKEFVDIRNIDPISDHITKRYTFQNMTNCGNVKSFQQPVTNSFSGTSKENSVSTGDKQKGNSSVKILSTVEHVNEVKIPFLKKQLPTFKSSKNCNDGNISDCMINRVCFINKCQTPQAIYNNLDNLYMYNASADLFSSVDSACIKYEEVKLTESTDLKPENCSLFVNELDLAVKNDVKLNFNFLQTLPTSVKDMFHQEMDKESCDSDPDLCDWQNFVPCSQSTPVLKHASSKRNSIVHLSFSSSQLKLGNHPQKRKTLKYLPLKQNFHWKSKKKLQKKKNLINSFLTRHSQTFDNSESFRGDKVMSNEFCKNQLKRDGKRADSSVITYNDNSAVTLHNNDEHNRHNTSGYMSEDLFGESSKTPFT
ncbi:DNA damage-induced apoptosis suppressor protein [Erpetoichthys calabaricus]|uniref:DNA damage-induced apoptosis suppressor protein n=1 Tax=Erpetoichthys calabaricus TaxID=27687 RepID=UPI002233FDBF|nr:DNA damage-induced apoptosis suppressor protein [Erpetoichthys calabaricus]